ncbi:ABC transporter substrate-binding protein [Candidatus Sumerlaeota bacterium]|nr:ABC transporter substrate-binding protein [Candidatus Sumerlaeota bacterium]
MHALRSLTLAMLALATLVACGGGESPAPAPSPAPEGGEEAVAPPSAAPLALILSQRGDALTLDPYDENETPTFSILSNIFDAIVDFDPDLQIAPGLATSWERVDDLTWDFQLREGVAFHSGDAFTADDVVFSFDRAQHWEESEAVGDILTIASVEAIDEHTVRFHTHQPDPILLRRVAQILIMDKESTEQAIEEHGVTWLVEHPNGTGPYRFVEWIREDHLTLEAFGGWRGTPTIERVIFRPISNDPTRLAALLAGDVHLITDVPVRDTDRIEGQPNLRLHRRPSLRLIYLGLDCGRDESPGLPDSPPNPLRDHRVREAIHLAIDEEAIVANTMNGFAEPAGQLVPPTVFGYNPAITRPAHNPERAMELLAEAGFPDGFRIRLDAPNNRYVNDHRIAQAIASQLARVGITVEVSARPKAIFFEDEELGECSMFLIGWSNSNGDVAGTFEFLLHTPDEARGLGSANSSNNYSNPELDALIEEAARTVDEGQRLEVLHRAMALVMEDLPQIPLHFQVDLYAAVSELDWTPRQDCRLRVMEMRWR